jgi:hypothetical protein
MALPGRGLLPRQFWENDIAAEAFLAPTVKELVPAVSGVGRRVDVTLAQGKR